MAAVYSSNRVALDRGFTLELPSALLCSIGSLFYSYIAVVSSKTWIKESNPEMITVDPHSTQVMQATETPEQMQQEAEQSGWFRVEPEFSWWYPWFRLHFIGQYVGETVIDVGIDLFGGDTGYFPDTLLRRKTNEWNQKVSSALLVGILATEGAIWLGSHFGIIYFGAVLLGYSLYKFLSLYANWNSVENLQISLESTFISLVLSVWSGLCSFLPEVWRAMAAVTASMKSWAFAFLCKLIMIPLNICLLIMTWNRIVALGGV